MSARRRRNTIVAKTLCMESAEGSLSLVNTFIKNTQFSSITSFSGFLQIIHHCRDLLWVSQSRRMDRQYWSYVSFVGHIEHAQEEAKRLLQILGGWDAYGASGWGQDGTEPVFASAGTSRHKTGASEKLREYYTDETERMAEDLAWEDFQNPLFEFNLTNVL